MNENVTPLACSPKDAAYTLTHGWLLACEVPEGVAEGAWLLLTPTVMACVEMVYDVRVNSVGVLNAVVKIGEPVAYSPRQSSWLDALSREMNQYSYGPLQSMIGAINPSDIVRITGAY